MSLENMWPKYQDVFICLLLFLLSQQLFAEPPFITPDADVLNYHHKQLYVGAILNGSNKVNVVQSPAIEFQYGILPYFELDILPSLNFYSANQSQAFGFGDVGINILYQLVTETTERPEVTIAFSPTIPIGNAHRNLGNGSPTLQLPISIEKSWHNWTGYLGGGYGINPANNMKNYFFGGIVLENNINEHWMFGGEIYSQGSTSNTAGFMTLLNLGGAYNFNANLSALFSAGHSILGAENYYAYLGFTSLW